VAGTATSFPVSSLRLALCGLAGASYEGSRKREDKLMTVLCFLAAAGVFGSDVP